LAIIGRSIKDERLLKLLRGMLDAGYLEDWQYHKTYSGTPQGGVISPLLSNIFLNELDRFVEEELIPQYTKGKRRVSNPEYERLCRKMKEAQNANDIERYKKLKKERNTLPSKDTDDPGFRRLNYVRYADDFLLGFLGPLSEAKEIKQKIGQFLSTLGLTMAEEKTLITHATTGQARFLGYDISIARVNDRITNKRRSINGKPMLRVPRVVAQEWKARYMRHGKSHHRAALMNRSDYDIVVTYNLEFQGLVNYYVLAHDVSAKLYPVKDVYRDSLVKTLAAKHKRSVTKIYRRYYRMQETGVKAIVIVVPRENRKPLVAKFGAKPIRFDKKAVISDIKPPLMLGRNELIDRLLANKCELCGAEAPLEGHHVRKLKDLQRRYQGRRAPPVWVVEMSERRRKTLMVCAECHRKIHVGTYDGPKLK
jgi:hypothetical protein